MIFSAFLTKESDNERPVVTGRRAITEIEPGIIPGTAVSITSDFFGRRHVQSSVTPVIVAQEVGYIYLSIDGTGYLGSSGVIRVQKPSAAATVRKAYLFASSTFSAIGGVTLQATPITWDVSTQIAFFYNYYADVTAIVKPLVDPQPSGIFNLVVTESSSGNTEGEILAVIFDDPNQTTTNTVVLQFSPLSTAFRSSFYLQFAAPLEPSSLVLDMSVGITFGYQTNTYSGQYSLIDIDGQRLTSSAGGCDDGSGANGALITVGGIGDTNLNPSPFALPTGTRTDDELYNLVPFATKGATNMKVDVNNPSQDDNFLFVAIFTNQLAYVPPPGGTPSQTPSKHPSKSLKPSKLPSQTPSKMPSKRPSKLPSQMPSKMPSKKPSRKPSVMPSKKPSRKPSKKPSFNICHRQCASPKGTFECLAPSFSPKASDKKCKKAGVNPQVCCQQISTNSRNSQVCGSKCMPYPSLDKGGAKFPSASSPAKATAQCHPIPNWEAKEIELGSCAEVTATVPVSTHGDARLIDQVVKSAKRPPEAEEHLPKKQTAGTNSNVHAAKVVIRRPVVKPRR